MRQNASVMRVLRERLTDPHHSLATIVTEMAGEGMANFIEAQKVLLNLAHEQNEIVINGVKGHVVDYAPVGAMIDMLRRSIDTFIEMEQEFLRIADKQAHTWMEAAKTGKPVKGEHLVELARAGMENFVRAEKHFLDVIAEETTKATSGKRVDGARKMKKAELAELARHATDALIEAQKKLVDVAGRQMNVGIKAATKSLQLVKPLPFVGLADLTREGVKSYVDAQKALMDVMLKPHNGHKGAAEHRAKRRRPPRPVRCAATPARVAAV